MGKSGNKYLYQTRVVKFNQKDTLYRPITNKPRGERQFDTVVQRLMRDGWVVWMDFDQLNKREPDGTLHGKILDRVALRKGSRVVGGKLKKSVMIIELIQWIERQEK